jgi:S-adenosylmethionine synthetase
MKNDWTVLLTGASGLLGSAVSERLTREGIRVLGLCNRQAGPGLVPVDLLRTESARDVERLEWNAAVNCAAFRSPDYCETHRDEARELNVRVPEWLARLAAVRKAPFIQISTDYVFPGTRPLYTEASPVEPVNFYGQTKVEAEAAVLAAHDGALVMRIPALYGPFRPPVFSPLLQEGIEAALGADSLTLDDVTVRYPTAVADVAEVIARAIPRRLTGLLHVSAGEAATRYAWACRIARWLGRDTARLRPGPAASDRPAKRPADCHLSTGRLESLGLPVPRPFSAVLPNLFREIGLL